MSLQIVQPGPQATIQAAPRRGRRHLGIPAAGPADGLSMALANCLVSNAIDDPALEITFGGFAAIFEADTIISLAGAPAEATLDGAPIDQHRTRRVKKGQRLEVGQALYGMRIYLAAAGGFRVPDVFGSASTYLPASFGGHEGRALRPGDHLAMNSPVEDVPSRQTPPEIRPVISQTSVLRVVPSAEFDNLTSLARRALFQNPFRAASQIDRMGIRLEGNPLELRPGAGQMTSSAVFPGTIQCPEGGEPVILGADSQTTGGYPRILSVIGADLHHLGQIRPRERVRFFLRTQDEALADDEGRARLLATWLKP